MDDPTGVIVEHKPSPNQSSYQFGQEAVRLIVVHTPEGSYEGTVNYLLRSSSKVSYHRLLSKDGTQATQLVEWGRKAWHALELNAVSEGISLSDFTGKTTSADERALAKTVAWRLVERGLPPRWAKGGHGEGFCRHADLQANRSDPMDAAKWRRRFVPAVKRYHAEYLRGADEAAFLRSQTGLWAFVAWWLGEGKWKSYGPRDAKVRPDVGRVPKRWWKVLRRVSRRRRGG